MVLTCTTCQKPNATFACGICQNTSCKKCVQFLPESQFSFLKNPDPKLLHGTYCPNCFDQHVAPELAAYEETMARARDVAVFYKTQNKETRSIKRKAESMRVENCDDKDETLLRLAFFAAKANFNTLLDVVITSEKDIVGGYQKSIWQGVGSPVNMDPNHTLHKREYMS